MQIARAEIIAPVTLLIHQSLWPFRPLLWILQSGCQPYAQADITSARQWSPDIAATVGAWRISPRSIIGKAPRSLICCNATASDFSEKSFSGQAACDARHPANGKKLVASGACWFEFCGFSVTRICEGDRVSGNSSHFPDVITMISGFLTSVISSLRPRQHIERTLIIDFYTPAFLAAKRLLNEPIESVPM